MDEQDGDNDIEVYGFDVANEKPASEQDELYKMITTIYKSTKLYKYSDKNNLSIEEVALKLGKIVMEDLKTDYEGKTFVVTEYKDYSVQVKKNHLGLKENQWLCEFDCKIKYTGNYATLGVLPKDMEWMEEINGDGSGEDCYFVIEKISDTDYVMRGFSKCKRYAIEG